MNWSLILNAILLIGVVVAIVRTVQTRRQQENKKEQVPVSERSSQSNFYDDIIAVRKLDEQDISAVRPRVAASPRQRVSVRPALGVVNESQSLTSKLRPTLIKESELKEETTVSSTTSTPASSESVMMFLLAKSNRQLAGYELLQAVLSAGFRFGEGELFHRHQYPNCQGPIMCSLAAATPSGTFDLQNIGGFVVHGLCLFMRIDGDPAVDAERFDVLLDTARTLSDSLDTYLLDDNREPLSEASIARYHQKLMLMDELVV